MDDYISREAVINITAETGAWKTQNRVRELPAADVQPVKHGHWIEHPDDIFPLESTIECSVCGKQENVNIHNDNYCPNCGGETHRRRGITMDRLTDKRFVGDGFHQPKSHEERLEIFTKVPHLRDIYNRLAEYEDTGLTPDEIMKLKEGNDNG